MEYNEFVTKELRTVAGPPRKVQFSFFDNFKYSLLVNLWIIMTKIENVKSDYIKNLFFTSESYEL